MNCHQCGAPLDDQVAGSCAHCGAENFGVRSHFRLDRTTVLVASGLAIATLLLGLVSILVVIGHGNG